MSGGSNWFAYRRPASGPSRPLICFHYAGGGASMFRAWAAPLQAITDVHAVQLPGRETRFNERPCPDLTRVVTELGATVLRELDEPPFLFGYSMGALLAFELARELRRFHRPIAGLIVAAAPAPQLARIRPRLHDVADEELIQALQALGATPTAVLRDEEMMRVIMPAVRADFALLENYRYSLERPLECPILALGGSHDREVGTAELEAWRVQSSRFRAIFYPAGHFFLRDHEGDVLAQIGSFIEAFTVRSR